MSMSFNIMPVLTAYKNYMNMYILNLIYIYIYIYIHIHIAKSPLRPGISLEDNNLLLKDVGV
jgi:hypothetical protein